MKIAFLLTAAFSLLLICCTRQTENINDFDYQKERLDELVALKPGKFIVYRLDSTVFTRLGRTTEIHRYRLKHEVDTMITDNLGRPGYRIFRYMTDSAGLAPWKPAGTYQITVLNDRVEVLEDNLRVTTLMTPVREGFSWKGNRHLPSGLYDASYADIHDWDFTYGPSADERIGQKNLADVRTVYQRDTSVNVNQQNGRPQVDTAYAYRVVSIQKYAKNIGLVFREQAVWERQPNPKLENNTITYDPFTVGFGVRMWMIDHN